MSERGVTMAAMGIRAGQGSDSSWRLAQQRYLERASSSRNVAVKNPSTTAAPAAHVRTQWSPHRPLHLAQTLQVLGRGSQDPTVQVVHTDCVWVTTRYGELPVTARFTRAPRRDEAAPATNAPRGGLEHLLRDVVIDAWGPGAPEWIQSAHLWCGAADDWAEFESSPAYSQLPHSLRQARHTHPGLLLPATATVVQRTILAVLEQRVTAIEAIRSYRFLLARHGEAAPPPAPAGMRIPPTAQQWRSIPSWVWHRAGVDPARAATVMRVVHRAAALNRLADTADAAHVRTTLQAIPGVGPWTAAEITQCTHADPDGVSIFDYHLADDVCWFFDGAPGSDQRMLELLEPWRGHRQRVVRLLKASGHRKPAFGPRLSPADHRHH